MGEMDNFEDAARVAATLEWIGTLPAADPLCPYCVVLNAEPWPEFVDEQLCAEHVTTFHALQCKGWNRDRWHQHLVGLARHGMLPESVDWWELPGGEMR